MKRILVIMGMLIVIFNMDAQNVGIGTDDPVSRLHVVGDIRSDSMYVTENIGIGTNSPGRPLTIRSSQDGGLMSIVNSNNVEKWSWLLDGENLTLSTGSMVPAFVADQYGNIGIWTANPQAKLHISNNVNSSGPSGLLLVENTGNGGAGIRFRNPATSSFPWQCYVSIDGKFRLGRDFIGENFFLITDDGYVGIGTSFPQARLHVHGDINLTGFIANESVVAPTLLNDWVNYNDGFQGAGYFKDKVGIVHLHGLIKSGTAAHIMTLPSEYRPVGTQIFTVVSGTGFARLDVNPDGTVVLSGSYNNAYVSLNGISFRV